ncbi:OapC/ArvC family zinc-ribbon domain-containing protein [Halegenticoccus soli]|uniref:OapC/ArvC family zinc-ribbon domain-containing protein n=1 Tax=Halegenticoccus soli TaxID=1985678 RepID=UPI000C6D7144|nr:Zn-ribbon containing protein [Halegenticoccus soli]
MPHQCTNCGKTFADGSKEMLSGCPQCGGNKFQFRPASSVDRSADAKTRSADAATGSDAIDSDAVELDATEPDTVEPGTTEPDAVEHATETDTTSSETTGGARAAVRDWVGLRRDDPSPASESDGAASDAETSDTEPASETRTVDTGPDAGSNTDSLDGPTDGPEDRAQASARSDVVSPEELSAARRTAPPETDGRVIEPKSDDRPDLAQLREELNDQFESIKILSPGQYELNLMELYDREEYIISLQEDGRYVIEVPDAWRSHDPDED